jgi:hypothetical protein
MKANRRIAVILTTGCALMLMMPLRTASADSFEDLSAEWWQWALSIPASVNPQLDTTGEDAVVGQRGEVWFLAGVFLGGTVVRTCSVPEGVHFFSRLLIACKLTLQMFAGSFPPIYPSQSCGLELQT